MPCWTIQEAKVEFASNTDRKLLLDALNSAGQRAVLQNDRITFASGEYDCVKHQFTFRGLNQQQAEEKVKEFKRAYSAQTVLSQAKRFGWQVKQTGQYAYEIIRR